MKEIRFRILDALARNLGRPMSIRGLTAEMGKNSKSSFYKNTYDEISKLKKEGLIKATPLGKSTLIELDFDSSSLADELSEMENGRKGEYFGKLNGNELQRELNWLYLGAGGQIGSILTINDPRSPALRKMEFLFILRPPLPGNGNYGGGRGLAFKEIEETRRSLYAITEQFAQKTNYGISFLALTLQEFESLINSPKASYLKYIARNEIAIFGAQFYWLQFYRMRFQGKLSLNPQGNDAEPDKLTQVDIYQAFTEYGYTETRNICATNACSIESAIAAALIMKEPRLLEAIPIILAKDTNRQICYPLIEFLANKYGNSSLFGFLLANALKAKQMSENTEGKALLQRLARINDVLKPTDPDSWQPGLRIRAADIKEKMGVYNVS